MYIILLWNTIQSSSIFNMVSKPLLWPFLSSLIFIGVTPSLLPSQQLPQPLAVEPPTSSSCCLRVPDLQPLLLRSPTPQTTACVVTAVYIALIAFLEVSLRSSSADLHVGESLVVTGDAMPSRTTQRFCVSAPCAVLNSNWRHLWRHQCHISPSHISIQSYADVNATSSY